MNFTHESTISHRNVAPLIANSLPAFMRTQEFSTFQEFIRLYVSWGEQSGNVGHTLGLLKVARDLNAAPDQILFNLKAEYG